MHNVLIVGGTGLVGGMTARLAARSGNRVRCLVREGSDDHSLRRDGLEVVRGDLTRPETLTAALDGIDVVITTAYGYARRRKGDTLASVDDAGNRHLIDAARTARIRRFVFTSILTADQAVSVPHFHQKALTEAYLEASGVPFVSLRPGGFLDTLLGMNLADLRNGRFRAMADVDAPASTILSSDVARALALAVDLPDIDGRRIDLGMAEPVTLRVLIEELSRLLGRSIRLSETPRPLRLLMFRVLGLFNPFLRDVGASMDYISSGRYVANTAQQAQFFGPLPTLRESLQRWIESTSFGGRSP